MRLGIHQPYLWPYLGYFQLIHAVDRFLLYDDVTYIKGGWINRNRLLLPNPAYVTLPLKGASSHARIADVSVDWGQIPRWRRKLQRSVEVGYARAPHKEQMLAVIEETLSGEGSIADVAQRGVEACCAVLGIETPIARSSEVAPKGTESGADRVMAICRSLGASEYVNAPGGRHLYAPSDFAAEGIALHFLAPHLEPYPQRVEPFTAGMSVLDAIAWLGPDAAALVPGYTLEA